MVVADVAAPVDLKMITELPDAIMMTKIQLVKEETMNLPSSKEEIAQIEEACEEVTALAGAAEEEATSCSLSAAGTTSVSLQLATTRTGIVKTSMTDHLVNAEAATMLAKILDLVAAATVEEEEHLVV